MASRFCFLALPDEVRDRIYHHYTIARGGYVYNPKTNKLRTADDGPIDISLMYTCRQAASEMDCLALNTNTITFYPDYSEESLPFAYFHGMKLLQVHHLKCQMFRGARWCFTKRLKTIFRNAYPELKSIFADLNTTLRFENMGYPLLDVYDAINQALYLSCFHHNFANVVRAAKNTWGHRTKPDFDDIISSPINPWDVTTPTDIDHTEFNEFHSSLPQSVQVTKYGFSAAALAVKFLGSIQTKTFSEIRNVVLEEDHPAVAMAASHARGLIPFCQRNPFLKIERRAHLWKNIFLQGVLPRACKYVPVCPPMRSIEVLDTHLSESLTRSVALWTVEALSLVPAGMPADQFSLV